MTGQGRPAQRRAARVGGDLEALDVAALGLVRSTISVLPVDLARRWLVAADALAAEGIATAVVSAPCFERFAAQPPAYRAEVLGTAPRVGVEAAVAQGWAELLGCDFAFVGMTGFGASAPAKDLYRHFGITPERVAAAARALLA